MSVLIHVELHGLAGRATELRGVLADHADRLAQAEACLGASAYEPLGREPGDFVLDAWWRDEDSLRGHYATSAYTSYARLVGALLARPSDATIHAIERSYQATADLSLDPTRQG